MYMTLLFITTSFGFHHEVKVQGALGELAVDLAEHPVAILEGVTEVVQGNSPCQGPGSEAA